MLDTFISSSSVRQRPINNCIRDPRTEKLVRADQDLEIFLGPGPVLVRGSLNCIVEKINSQKSRILLWQIILTRPEIYSKWHISSFFLSVSHSCPSDSSNEWIRLREQNVKWVIVRARSKKVKPDAGLEPATVGLKVQRSTDWANQALRNCRR